MNITDLKQYSQLTKDYNKVTQEDYNKLNATEKEKFNEQEEKMYDFGYALACELFDIADKHHFDSTNASAIEKALSKCKKENQKELQRAKTLSKIVFGRNANIEWVCR